VPLGVAMVSFLMRMSTPLACPAPSWHLTLSLGVEQVSSDAPCAAQSPRNFRRRLKERMRKRDVTFGT
jgi:hypothetical protein